MARYDGLIIPRSYSEYINKTDAATLSQALQQSGVMDAAPTAGSNKPAKSGGVYTALAGKQATLTFDNVPTAGSSNPVTSAGIYTSKKIFSGRIEAGKTLTITMTSGYGSFEGTLQILGSGANNFLFRHYYGLMPRLYILSSLTVSDTTFLAYSARSLPYTNVLTINTTSSRTWTIVNDGSETELFTFYGDIDSVSIS